MIDMDNFMEIMSPTMDIVLRLVILILSIALLPAYIKAVKKTKAGEMVVFTDWKDVGKSLVTSLILYLCVISVVAAAGFVIFTVFALISSFRGDSSVLSLVLLILGSIAICIVAPFWIRFCVRRVKNSWQDSLIANPGNVEHARLSKLPNY